MELEITKKCADSLRSFAQNNYGIQLKSSHAHELVAAYFGYSSRAALLADTKSPITNLRQAEFVVLTPTAPIKERCNELNGLPENLPHELVEGVYLPLYDENDKWILTQVWPNLEELGKVLADEHANLNPYHSPFQKIQRQGVKVEFENDLVGIVVFREYINPGLTLASGKNVVRGVVDVFNLKRVAGHIGYVQENHFSTEAETLDAAIMKMGDVYSKIITSAQNSTHAESVFESEPTFTEWLKKQKNRDSPLGDLAMDMLRDKTWPTLSTLETYRDYLHSKNASWQTVQTLERAWKSYKAFLARKNPA
ncbi:MAG: hypothetical protein EOP47_11410 [Sphingobacteriaceae bacterium]|nr:MAG: hypothetical protein EOP47_11410 [Sphingobacteriaceae bacterium]